jgi:hypothetical protein
MRKLILKMSILLDGFVGGPNGELDWLMAIQRLVRFDCTLAGDWNRWRPPSVFVIGASSGGHRFSGPPFCGHRRRPLTDVEKTDCLRSIGEILRMDEVGIARDLRKCTIFWRAFRLNRRNGCRQSSP